MSRRPRKFTFRLTPEEYDFLEGKAKEKNHKVLSSYVRETLLERTGHSSADISRQLKSLSWEINKIGTNINQAARRINSGYTDRSGDVADLLSNQEKIILLFETYEKKVEDAWQSQS